MNIIHIATAEGDIEIREDELASVTGADLEWMEISRDDLHRCFAEGVELMRSVESGTRVRPVAYETRDGTWEVELIGYSAL